MESKFELSATEIEGLKRLNNEINEEITKKIIVNAVKQLVVKGPGKKCEISFESPKFIFNFFDSDCSKNGYL